MAYYHIDPNIKEKAEEKIVYQLGGPELTEKYSQSRNLESKGNTISGILGAAGFILIILGIFLLHSLVIGLFSFLMIAASVISAISFKLISLDQKKQALELSPDLTMIITDDDSSRLEINGNGISHLYLYSKGSDDSPDSYRNEIIETNNITDIFRCEQLGVIIVCGKVSLYRASGNIINQTPESVRWSLINSESGYSIRLYDYWISNSTGLRDTANVLVSAFGISIKDIDISQAMEIINKDRQISLSQPKYNNSVTL